MKNTHRRLIALLATVALLITGIGAQSFALAEDFFAPRNDAGIPADFWEYLADSARKGETVVDVSSYGIAYSDAVCEEIKTYLFEKRPDLFHVSDSVSFGYYPGGELLSVQLRYRYTVAEYETMLKKVEAAADRLLTGIAGNSALTDVQKALLLHDRLAVHCEYDRGVLAKKAAAANARNIYGALVERSAVCDGYTRTYIYLLGKVGIRSEMNRSDKLIHSWNIVYIDGKPYHVDVTFDDPSYDMTGRVLHEHFLLSSAALYKREHAANDYNTAPNDTRYDNYFWQNSNAAFLLANGQIYYIDNVNASLNRFDQTKLMELSTDWSGWFTEGAQKQKINCFSCGATDGTVLLYTDSHSVWKYDPASGSTEKVFTPEDASGKKMIFGMVLEDGNIVCDFTDSLNNYGSVKRESMWVKKAYVAHVHTWDGGKVTKAATCAAEGEKTYTCTGCSATKKEKIAKTENHQWDAGAVTTPPTCKEAGIKTYTCSVCRLTRTETVKKTENHTWDAGTVTMPATCKDEGVKTYTCTVCGTEKKEPVARLTVHIWDNGKVLKEASADAEGEILYTCTVCGATHKDVIPPSETPHIHNWGAGVVATPATCAAEGVQQYTCAVCGAIKTIAIPKSTEHTWNEGKVVKAADVGVEGEVCFTCTVCGATKTEKIPPKETGKPSDAFCTGDVDGDGVVSSADARLALRASVQLEVIAPDSPAFKAADADRDGALTPADARLILRASVGLEELP